MLDLDGIEGAMKECGGVIPMRKSLVRALVAHCRELQAWQDDVNETHRQVMAEECAPDEVHCTCVPHLRKGIAELEAKVAHYKNPAHGAEFGQLIKDCEGLRRRIRELEHVVSIQDLTKCDKCGTWRYAGVGGIDWCPACLRETLASVAFQCKGCEEWRHLDEIAGAFPAAQGGGALCSTCERSRDDDARHEAQMRGTE